MVERESICIRSFVFDVVLPYTDLNLDLNRPIYVWLPFWDSCRSDYVAHSSSNDILYFIFIFKKYHTSKRVIKIM